MEGDREFHLFISHHQTNREDLEFVIDFRSRLEGKAFTICNPQEEFELNYTLEQNIQKCIEKSMKTVLVVSDVYLESNGCRRELDVIYNYMLLRQKTSSKGSDNTLENRNGIIIPLFLENTDLNKVPAGVKHIQGIRVKDLNWFEQIENVLLKTPSAELASKNTVDTCIRKRYNVFFSYKTVSPDKDWVRNVVDSLEASHPKVVCAYHERDFNAGISVIENIKFCIENSEKVVIVLSPEFLQSEWTQYETEIAQFRTISKPGDLGLIPVLLEDCDIPERLINITYLDVRQEESRWLAKLLEAVNSPNTNIKLRTLGKHEEIQTLKLGVFGGRTESDDHESWLIEAVFTSNESIVVTDAKNFRLKRFSLKGNLESSIAFVTRPMFLTLFDDDCVYVTFPDENVIRIVDAAQDNMLIAVGDIDVPKHCSGIACYGQEKFAVCIRKECLIQIMSRKGEIIRKILPQVGLNELGNVIGTRPKKHDVTYDTDEECDDAIETNSSAGKKDFAFYKEHRANVDAKNRLVLPGHLTSSRDGSQFFLTDYDTKHLTAIYLDDSDRFMHRSLALNEPRGAAIHGERLYVAAGAVRLFGPDLSEHGEIPLHGGAITFPRSVALDSKTRYLAVTHKGDADDGISVFRLLSVL